MRAGDMREAHQRLEKDHDGGTLAINAIDQSTGSLDYAWFQYLRGATTIDEPGISHQDLYTVYIYIIGLPNIHVFVDSEQLWKTPRFSLKHRNAGMFLHGELRTSTVGRRCVIFLTLVSQISVRACFFSQ